MAAQWERWLKYAKARFDATLAKGETEMDRLEAEQAARAEGKPWLSSTSDAPSFDEAKARIEAQAEAAGRTAPTEGPASPSSSSSGPPSDVPGASGAAPSAPDIRKPSPTAAPAGDAIDFAAQQKAAEERLAQMRAELGLDDPPPDGKD